MSSNYVFSVSEPGVSGLEKLYQASPGMYVATEEDGIFPRGHIILASKDFAISLNDPGISHLYGPSEKDPLAAHGPGVKALRRGTSINIEVTG